MTLTFSDPAVGQYFTNMCFTYLALHLFATDVVINMCAEIDTCLSTYLVLESFAVYQRSIGHIACKMHI